MKVVFQTEDGKEFFAKNVEENPEAFLDLLWSVKVQVLSQHFGLSVMEQYKLEMNK